MAADIAQGRSTEQASVIACSSTSASECPSKPRL
jgi:hypothetical protein